MAGIGAAASAKNPTGPIGNSGTLLEVRCGLALIRRSAMGPEPLPATTDTI